MKNDVMYFDKYQAEWLLPSISLQLRHLFVVLFIRRVG